MRITSVGSFPKLPEIKANSRTARTKKVAIKAATKFWIRKQEELGYDILVHGEQERDDMVAYFGTVIEGMRPGNQPVRSYGNRFWVPPEIHSEVRWKKPLTLEMWKYAQSLTKKPMKGMLTGPGTIYDWSIDLHYGNRKQAVKALALVLRREIVELQKAGARYIQIDEPSLAHVPDTKTLNEALGIMTDGVSAYFILHTCYGTDIFEDIYPEMLKFPVHNLDLELANNDMQLLETIRKHPIKRDLTLGVVDVHDHNIESVDTVRERIEKIREVVPDEKLWIDPDCGLKTRSVEEAIQKLKVIAEARKDS